MKYKENPQITTINPYKDKASLFKVVPTPTIIAPIISRVIPVLTGVGTLVFFFSSFLYSSWCY